MVSIPSADVEKILWEGWRSRKKFQMNLLFQYSKAWFSDLNINHLMQIKTIE